MPETAPEHAVLTGPDGLPSVSVDIRAVLLEGLALAQQIAAHADDPAAVFDAIVAARSSAGHGWTAVSVYALLFLGHGIVGPAFERLAQADVGGAEVAEAINARVEGFAEWRFAERQVS